MTAFLIRRISTTADGREIVRDQPVDQSSIRVGRGPDNDIVLADLALEADHATIVLGTNGNVHVGATGTASLRVDGRRKAQADIDPATGAVIGLGEHNITVSREGAVIVLTVQRVVAISRSAAEIDERRAFSIGGLMLSKRGTAWLLALSVLIGFLAIPIYQYAARQGPDHRNIYAVHVDKSWSSGPLSAAHHQLEGKCEACHVKAFVSVRDETCQSCHKNTHDHAPIARIRQAQIAPDFGGRMLAGVAHFFGKEGRDSCVSCHSEHEGAGWMPPTKQAFCSDCHSDLKARLPDTKLADASDFGKQHPQFQPIVAKTPGTKPVLVRASLDTHPSDDSGLKFPHKMHLDRFGGVAQMARTLKGRMGYGDSLACADCHTPSKDGVRFAPVDMEKDCQACHSLGIGGGRTLRHGDVSRMIADLRGTPRVRAARPINTGGGIPRRRPGAYGDGQVYHASFGNGGLGAENILRAVFSPGGACYDCHIVTPPGASATGQWDVTAVHQQMRYLAKGWFDHNAHKAQKCASCHAADTSTRATDLLLPDLKSCRSCHGGELSKAKVPSSCAMCHSFHIKQNAPWQSHDKPRKKTESPRIAANRPRGFAAQD